MEIVHFLGTAVMAALLICSFAISDMIVEFIADGKLDITAYGYESSIIENAGNVNMASLRIFAAGGIIIMLLMAMTFRNAYLIVKNSKNSTPFQKSNVRKIKKIGIFVMALPVIQLIMSILVPLIAGANAVEINVNISDFIIGVLVLCLMQFFAHGVELEEEVDGLV